MDEVNKVTLGVVQFACSDDVGENIATASRLVRAAAAEGLRGRLPPTTASVSDRVASG